jgi:tetratricopeptide (TPR) repeat protein
VLIVDALRGGMPNYAFFASGPRTRGAVFMRDLFKRSRRDMLYYTNMCQLMGVYMNRRIIAFLLILCSATVALSAQELFVSFLDGEVEVIEGTRSYEPFIGDVILLDAKIRLSEGASLELEGNGARVFLNSPGTFSVRRLFSAGAGQQSRGVLGSLSRRIGELNGSDEDLRENTSIAGVRASDAATQDDIQWAGAELGDIYAEGFAALENGNVDEAYYAFEEAYFMASDSELAEAAYYLGYTAVLRGDLDEADELYAEVDLDSGDGDLYYLFQLSSADLHLKLGDYPGVISGLEELISTTALGPADIQLAHYYRAMAYAGLGDQRRRDADLRRVTEINANPQLTGVAEEILWNEN